MADIKNENIKNENIEYELPNTVFIDTMVLPNRDYIKILFNLNNEELPKLSDKEQRAIRVGKKVQKNDKIVTEYAFGNPKFIHNLLSNSISENENIDVFLDEIKLGNWEEVFYIALLSQYGFMLEGTTLQNRNYNFFSELIRNNPYRFNKVNIPAVDTRQNRIMLLTLYKCKLALDCNLPYTLLGYSSKLLDLRNMVISITDFLPRYKLRDWVDEGKLNWFLLINNPNAIDLIEKNLDNPWKIDWFHLSGNPNAIDILKKNLDIPGKVSWNKLSGNPNAIDILKNNLDKVKWNELSGNPNAIDILKNNLDKVKWDELSDNPNAIDILENNLDKIDDWSGLSNNPNAIRILEDELERDPEGKRLNWFYLSGNPNAIHILEKYLDIPGKIDWERLSANPNAIRLIKAELKENPNSQKIDWVGLSRNPNAIDILEEESKRENSRVDWVGLSRNPNAIRILEEELEKENSRVDWPALSENPNAIHILEANLNRVSWALLSSNPAIFEPVPNMLLYKYLTQQ